MSESTGKNVPDAVTLTQELIRFDTMNPPGDEHDCASYLSKLLEAAGFTVTESAFKPRRTSLIARLGKGSGKPLCFTGHIDTVPLGQQAWSVDPFAGEIRDGKLYGRGSSDMKSGVAAFVVAAIDMAASMQDTCGVELVITAGEETGCEGAAHLCADPATLAQAGALVVAEPTSNYPLCGHKGAYWLRAITTGVTAHGSMPERGENAIYKAADLVLRLRDFGFDVDAHPVMGPATLNVGSITGGMNHNSVPDRTEIGIDIRLIPGVESAAVRQRLQGCLAPELAELQTMVELPGVWTEPEDPWMQQVFTVMSELLDEPLQPRSVSYFTDASVLTPHYGNVPTVVLGPGEAALAHQTDEYCYVSRIEQAVTAYRRLIANWIGKPCT